MHEIIAYNKVTRIWIYFIVVFGFGFNYLDLDRIRIFIKVNPLLSDRNKGFRRDAKYSKNHFQQNRYSVFESHMMRKESISTKILRSHGNGEVVKGFV